MAPTSITTHQDRRLEKLRRAVRQANRHATTRQRGLIRHILQQHAQGTMGLADVEHMIAGIRGEQQRQEREAA
jgi:hypothetical protein